MASNNSRGTVVLTGANGALGRASVKAFLETYPSYFLVLTVRNISAPDPNTTKLRAIVESFKSANVSIESLDLSSLLEVRAFADDIAERVTAKKIPPISAIVCNAHSWSLVETRQTRDGYEDTFHVTHLSHFILVLKLLNSLNKENGRILFIGSYKHDPARKNWMNPLGAAIPENIEELVKPPVDPKGQEFSRGFLRYANAKLAAVMFLHSLNRKLPQNPTLQNITATAMDPGPMPDSNNMRNTPRLMRVAMAVATLVARVVDSFTETVRTSKLSGKDLTVLSVAPEKAGARGYFEGLVPARSSEESLDEAKQEAVWKACVQWAGLEQSETILSLD